MPNLQLRNRLMAAITAFREPNLIMNILKSEDFDDFEARLNRYSILWGFYENTIYNEMHSWARQYKLRFGLYRYIRNIYNPAYRLGNFHQTYLWGGLLDREAGDGRLEPSALPIETENERIRPAIANIWKWSNWQSKKDLHTLYGSVMGDSAIRIVDSTRHKKVFFEVIHPRLIKDITKDELGNVKAYELEEERPDPRRNSTSNTVTYTEKVQRGNGEDVEFQTFLDGKLYPWNFDANDQPLPEWTEPYGFIPFVHTLHIDVGNDFGWAEMHALRGKFQEVDDLASKLHDFIRKEVEGLFFIAGMQKPKDDPKIATGASSRDRQQPGREEVGTMYGPSGATATSLVSDHDIMASLETIKAAAEEIERELPELGLDENNEVAALSGRALRTRQQPATGKIEMRRPAYDDSLVRAHQMAMSIGEGRGYDGFKGIGTFDAGEFKHNIGKRPVFKVDRIDELEEDKVFWETASIARASGVELSSWLKAKGWTKEMVNDLLRATARRESRDIRRANRTPVEVQSTQEAGEQTSEDIVDEARENE